MLRLSDADETRFYRAFGAIGKKTGLKDQFADFVLKSRGFHANACAMIAGFEGDAGAVAASQKQFAAVAKEVRCDGTGAKGKVSAGAMADFHGGPYLREPMMDRGIGVDTLETAASWSKIDALRTAVRAALDTAMRGTAPRPGAHGVVMCHISHSYSDGASLYFTYFFPRALGSELAQWQTIKNAASDAIVANGGTISHHHGVGEDHLPWIAQEKGPLGIAVLRAIKGALDPKGILNPGKLIP